MLALLTGGPVAAAESTPPLPRLGADIAGITLSGLSSGAYMAAQLQMAHSGMVAGVGLVAGGLFGCVESVDNPLVHMSRIKAVQALQVCMLANYRMWGIPNARSLVRLARRLAAEDAIDPVSSVKADRIYLFTGRNDGRVATAILDVAAEFYKQLDVPDRNLLFERDRLEAAHAFVTEDTGAKCDVSEAPFLADCDYDQARAILEHLLGKLTAPAAPREDGYRIFDQGEFSRDLGSHGLGAEGVVYVPRACAGASQCRLHIVLHGCSQNRDQIGDAFIRGSGYARWAEANRIVVLFPQTATSGASESGCWDWWGYTGPDYHTRKAPQIRAIHRMVERLGARPH